MTWSHLPPAVIEDAIVLDPELDRSSTLDPSPFRSSDCPKNGLTRLVQVVVPAIPGSLLIFEIQEGQKFQLKAGDSPPILD